MLVYGKRTPDFNPFPTQNLPCNETSIQLTRKWWIFLMVEATISSVLQSQHRFICLSSEKTGNHFCSSMYKCRHALLGSRSDSLSFSILHTGVLFLLIDNVLQKTHRASEICDKGRRNNAAYNFCVGSQCESKRLSFDALTWSVRPSRDSHGDSYKRMLMYMADITLGWLSCAYRVLLNFWGSCLFFAPQHGSRSL